MADGKPVLDYGASQPRGMRSTRPWVITLLIVLLVLAVAALLSPFLALLLLPLNPSD